MTSSEFPFILDEPFKVAVGLADKSFKVAVNGQLLMEFPMENIELEEGQGGVWDILTGFKVKVGLGLSLQITEVEHIQVGGDKECDGFEIYSDLNALN